MKYSLPRRGPGGAWPLLLLFIVAGMAGCAASQGGSQARATQVGKIGSEPVMLETVQRATYFTGQYEMPADQIRERTRPLAQRVAIAAVKNAKLEIVGPLTLFLPDWSQSTTGDIALEVGYPVSGAGQPLANYKRRSRDGFQSLTVSRQAGSDNQEAWAELYRIANQQGLSASGENRTVIARSGSGYQVELQLGVR